VFQTEVLNTREWLTCVRKAGRGKEVMSPEETTAMLRSEGAKEKQHNAEPVVTVTTETVKLSFLPSGLIQSIKYDAGRNPVFLSLSPVFPGLSLMPSTE